MHVFYCIMKGIYQFAANLLSYIPTKYYWNRSTSDLEKQKGELFLKHSVYTWNSIFSVDSNEKSTEWKVALCIMHECVLYARFYGKLKDA